MRQHRLHMRTNHMPRQWWPPPSGRCQNLPDLHQQNFHNMYRMPTASRPRVAKMHIPFKKMTKSGVTVQAPTGTIGRILRKSGMIRIGQTRVMANVHGNHGSLGSLGTRGRRVTTRWVTRLMMIPNAKNLRRMNQSPRNASKNSVSFWTNTPATSHARSTTSGYGFACAGHQLLCLHMWCQPRERLRWRTGRIITMTQRM